MSHYFDDIFQRSVKLGTPRSPSVRHLRRSSTARSIGARSDFDSSLNGYEDDAGSANSVVLDDPEREHEKTEADSHLHRYISDQLERYKDENLSGAYVQEDEFETKA